MTDLQLMQAIKDGYGELIGEAVQPTTLPAGFLAALVANESGGHNDARRFEPKVLGSLWEVLLGRKTAYGSIGRAVLVNYFAAVRNGQLAVTPNSLPPDAFERVDALASSWGLTQIMGYHVLGTSHDVDDLKLPETHLPFAVKMLHGFAEEFKFDPATDFEKLFRCWNTGRPDGQTFDPNYVSNGLVRIAVWSSL